MSSGCADCKSGSAAWPSILHPESIWGDLQGAAVCIVKLCTRLASGCTASVRQLGPGQQISQLDTHRLWARSACAQNSVQQSE